MLKERYSRSQPWEPLLALQLRTGAKPLLPNLKSLKLTDIEEKHAPLIPLLLSPRITFIHLKFESGFPEVVLASVLTALPTLFPNLREINLPSLPRDPMVTASVSKMLLAVNRSSLQRLRIFSPLTEEVTRTLCDLRDIREPWLVVSGHGS